jgi:endonuclease YncB( thermonuclease family)
MLLLALFSGIAAGAQAVEGIVRHVTDGDSLVLQPDAPGAKPIKLRLLGLDAPEICQAGGVEARDALARRVAGRRVIAVGSVTDAYRRRLVTILLEGEDIGAWMVREGHAWNMRFRGRPGRYDAAEREARAARRGVFTEPNPLPPRVFRHQHGSCFPTAADRQACAARGHRHLRWPHSRHATEALRRTQPCARGNRFAVARFGTGDERADQLARALRDLGDGLLEGRLVRARWHGKATELAHELQRRVTDFNLGRRRVEVEQRLDVAAHGASPGEAFAARVNRARSASS